VEKYLKFKRLMDSLVRLAEEREPDVIVCVDFSLFNAHFAKVIKSRVRRRLGAFNNWNPKLVKYVSPQVWASREGRAWKMARDFDLLLSIFPFEKEWFARRIPRFQVEFVGHPMMDRYSEINCNRAAAEKENALVALLPGSRKSELQRIFL